MSPTSSPPASNAGGSASGSAISGLPDLSALDSGNQSDPLAASKWLNTRIAGSGALVGGGPDMTAAELLAQFLRMSGPQVADVQRKLQLGGYYGKGRPSLGNFTGLDANVLKGALQDIATTALAPGANGTTVDIGQYLTAAAQTGRANGLGLSQNQLQRSVSPTETQNIQLRNRNDLGGLVENAFQKALGRGAKPDELAKFVSAIQGDEFGKAANSFNRARSAQEADLNYAYDQQASSLQSTDPGDTHVEDIAQQAGIDPKQLQAFMGAMRGNESSNNYAWRSNAQGATGAYQILASNYPSWARQAGVDPNDHSPQAQDRVAAVQIANYYRHFNGSWSLVAAAWQAGVGAADKIARNPGYASQIRDANETTQKYMDNQMAAFSRVYSQIAPTPTGASPVPGSPGAPSNDPNQQDVTQFIGPRPQLGPVDRYTTESPVETSAGVEQQVRQQHPIEAGANDMLGQFNNFLQAIGKAV